VRPRFRLTQTVGLNGISAKVGVSFEHVSSVVPNVEILIKVSLPMKGLSENREIARYYKKSL